MSQPKQELRFDFNAMSADDVVATLKQYQIALTPDEVLKIQTEILQRSPTLSECILWSIQGSEHCSYKSTRRYLSQFNTNASNIMLGPSEDAGIVTVATDKKGRRYGIAISHESHNHPSQLVPYEGAATGVGGNLRDVCCMGAEVIAMADGLRFGDINLPKTQWLHHGVVDGIAGYGNPTGIPNIAGDVCYHPGYNENCLVTVTTLGVLREDQLIHSYVPKDLDLNQESYELILIGKPTDNSGFGGASFASGDLAEDKPNKGAVQEPNAFLGRHLLKANYALFDQLRKKKLIKKVGFKDLGAGGIACATVEIAEASGYGADVCLDQVHTSMDDLSPAVILCAETQERYLWAVPASISQMVLDHYNKTYALPHVSFGSQASIIGTVRADGWYQVTYGDQTLISAKASDITSGIQYQRPVKERSIKHSEPKLIQPDDYNNCLLNLLSHPNIASTEVIAENYDKQVQGRTQLERGIGTAGVIQPFNSPNYPTEIQTIGVALAVGQNPFYNAIDPYFGAMNAVASVLRKVAAVGASPQALTDCLCYGNPETPEQMADFSEGVCGIIDACKEYVLKEAPNESIPIVAGNVSLYNETKTQGAIPPSPMMSCLATMPAADKAVSLAFKQIDSCILMIGDRQDELGGSVYYQLQQALGAQVPAPNMSLLTREIHALLEAIDQGLILAANTIGEGGLATAITLMSIPNQVGANIYVPSPLAPDRILFSESGGFVLEVAQENLATVEQIFAKHDTCSVFIGRTDVSKKLRLQDCIDLSVVFAQQAWREGLREKL